VFCFTTAADALPSALPLLQLQLQLLLLSLLSLLLLLLLLMLLLMLLLLLLLMLLLLLPLLMLLLLLPVCTRRSARQLQHGPAGRTERLGHQRLHVHVCRQLAEQLRHAAALHVHPPQEGLHDQHHEQQRQHPRHHKQPHVHVQRGLERGQDVGCVLAGCRVHAGVQVEAGHLEGQAEAPIR
jgi:uncharacterized protein (DUF58 family)